MSGVAATRLLLEEGADVVGNDRRSREELDPEVLALGAQLVLGGHPPELAREADLVVLSPGVRLETPLVEEAYRREIPVWSELELGFRNAPGVIVAVTGTKGKSTTATLIHDMLRVGGTDVRLAGNIGSPLCAEVGGASAKTVFVVEASSFQLAAIDSFRPHVAVLLDVSPDHLDWHPSFDAYVEAKSRVFVNQSPDDWGVVYGGNSLTVDMASKGKARKLYFDIECLSSLSPHLHKDGPWIVRHENGEVVPLASVEEFNLPGRHNHLNAIAASATASLLGVSGEELEEAFEHFSGLPHALERVADIEGVRYYNDSKATNVQAVRAALDSFDGPILLILGGRFKGGDFRDLRESVSKRVRRVFALGESREQVREALQDIVDVTLCADLDSAVFKAHQLAVRGDVVLLSPAGSSFDMFRDYRERGERFREIVHGLEAGRK